MNEKEYAFYIQENDIEDVLKNGNENELRQIHIASFTQVEGNDRSYHGSPMYETITILNDVKTGKAYRHNDYGYNRVSFLKFDDVDQEIEKYTKRINSEIEDLNMKINTLIHEKNMLETNKKRLHASMDEHYSKERMNEDRYDIIKNTVNQIYDKKFEDLQYRADEKMMDLSEFDCREEIVERVTQEMFQNGGDIKQIENELSADDKVWLEKMNEVFTQFQLDDICAIKR